MKVLVKTPAGKWHAEEIENTLEALQAKVEGHIEAVQFAEDAAIICNENGRLLGLPYNTEVIGIDFVGPIAFVGVDGEDFTDAPVSLEVWRAICGED